MECVAPAVLPVPDKSWKNGTVVLSTSPSDPSVPDPDAPGEMLMLLLQVKPSGRCPKVLLTFCTPTIASQPYLWTNETEQLSWHVAALQAPWAHTAQSACVGDCTGLCKVSSECWEKCSLPHLACTAFPAEPRGTLPASGSEGVSKKEEMKII